MIYLFVLDLQRDEEENHRNNMVYTKAEEKTLTWQTCVWYDDYDHSISFRQRLINLLFFIYFRSD